MFVDANVHWLPSYAMPRLGFCLCFGHSLWNFSLSGSRMENDGECRALQDPRWEPNVEIC